MNDALEHDVCAMCIVLYLFHTLILCLHFPYIHTKQRGKNSLILFFSFMVTFGNEHKTNCVLDHLTNMCKYHYCSVSKVLHNTC